MICLSTSEPQQKIALGIITEPIFWVNGEHGEEALATFGVSCLECESRNCHLWWLDENCEPREYACTSCEKDFLAQPVFFEQGNS